MSRTMTMLPRAILKNLLVMMSAVVLLQACGGGHKSAAPAPVPVITDPTGYYSNNGTLPALGITDLQGIVTSTRFIMASKLQGYYYDGPITVTGNTITGNLVQFGEPGGAYDAATLNAAINNSDHSISGTLAYTSDGHSDSFTLHYATGRANSTVSAIINAGGNPSWTGTLYSMVADPLTFSLADNTLGAAAMTTVTPMTTANNANFRNCVFTGTLTPITGTSLYEATITTSGCLNTGANTNSFGGPYIYTGFAALRTQTALNDTLVLAFNMLNSGYYALFGEFQ